MKRIWLPWKRKTIRGLDYENIANVVNFILLSKRSRDHTRETHAAYRKLWGYQTSIFRSTLLFLLLPIFDIILQPTTTFLFILLFWLAMLSRLCNSLIIIRWLCVSVFILFAEGFKYNTLFLCVYRVYTTPLSFKTLPKKKKPEKI